MVPDKIKATSTIIRFSVKTKLPPTNWSNDVTYKKSDGKIANISESMFGVVSMVFYFIFMYFFLDSIIQFTK